MGIFRYAKWEIFQILYRVVQSFKIKFLPDFTIRSNGWTVDKINAEEMQSYIPLIQCLIFIYIRATKIIIIIIITSRFQITFSVFILFMSPMKQNSITIKILLKSTSEER